MERQIFKKNSRRKEDMCRNHAKATLHRKHRMQTGGHRKEMETERRIQYWV